jgi:hypothetical protein
MNKKNNIEVKNVKKSYNYKIKEKKTIETFKKPIIIPNKMKEFDKKPINILVSF